MRVNVNGFRFRFQADREQVSVHVRVHGGSKDVISTEHMEAQKRYAIRELSVAPQRSLPDEQSLRDYLAASPSHQAQPHGQMGQK